MSPKEKIEENYKLALSSVDQLLDQCVQAWEEGQKVVSPELCPVFDKMLICGMGGSALPAHIIESVLPIRVPMFVVEDYSLPNWVDENTLVVLSSYSGNTEETLSCAKLARSSNCKMLGITGGGELDRILSEWNVPHYTFDPKHNPSGLPRFGIGYGIFGLLGIMHKCGMFDLNQEKDLPQLMEEAVAYVTSKKDEVRSKVESLLGQDTDKVFVVFSSAHLDGNGKTFANQLNETSKTLAFKVELPDADHNLIEGFLKGKDNVCAFFIKSKNYHDRIQERFRITETLITNDTYQTQSFEPTSSDNFTQMLETLYFSSLFSVLLSRENNVDPLSIPAVEYIKSQLLLFKE